MKAAKAHTNFSAFITGVSIPERQNTPDEEDFMSSSTNRLGLVLKEYCEAHYIDIDNISVDDIKVIFETHNVNQDTLVSVKKYYHLNKLIFSCYFIMNKKINELEFKIYKNF